MTYISAGKSLLLDETKCTGCGRCVDVCPHAVLALRGSKVYISNRKNCMGCGACQKNCPFGALSVESGVGCAYGVIAGFLKGTGPECGCSGGKGGCC